jgi:lipopolysaccharide transport system ATP-binding protein
MSNTVIKVDNVGKLYRLGEIGTGTLQQDINRWWARMLGKEDPLAKVGEVNDRTKKGEKKYSWALKDINFSVQQGEVLGIIGSNGAGKSTLLKILSQITTPTEGNIKIKGHIASLLEVGTGFHPELTGRENIFLNGAILGMPKKEIRSKFDEIVDFAGVERYIDTPVKRYSSGMYVRLAFAVAAHLEPEILVIDEVLAVGDADFQKKCLGKMKEVSQTDGRTILFVSHNMQAINSLCNKALWLHQGGVKEIGETSGIINKYISGIQQLKLKQTWDELHSAPGNEWIRFKKVEIIPDLLNEDDPLDIRVPLNVKFQFWNMSDDISLKMGLHLYTLAGECIFDVPSPVIACNKGLIEGECTIPGNFLNDGSYYISLIVVRINPSSSFYFNECLSFNLEDYRADTKWFGKWIGAVRPRLPFRLEQLNPIMHE